MVTQSIVKIITRVTCFMAYKLLPLYVIARAYGYTSLPLCAYLYDFYVNRTYVSIGIGDLRLSL